MKRRVVITGVGAVSPIGNTAQELWHNAKDGVCGIDKITSYDTANQKVTLAGEIKNFNPEEFLNKKEIRKLDRFTQLALVASQEAFAQSGLDIKKEDAHRCGVIVSSGIGGLDIIEQEHNRGLEKGFDRVSPFFIPMAISNMAAGSIAIQHSLKGMCTCVVTACASGTNAVGDAFRYIRDGYGEVMVCGGAESCITPLGIGGFTSLRALSEATDPNRASIPFDKNRDGFVMGEGAGILILEEYEHAVARNASIICEVVGYGASCDAYHMTAPSPDGSGAASCMQAAVADAGISPDVVDYINAHGTSTPMNDQCETAAIKLAFGEHAGKLMVSSTKSMTGHLLGASGAVEAILTALAIKDSFVPPTVNYREPDEACDLDIVPNTGRTAKLRYAMSNSLGFGGHNATILLKKYEV
ncbi:MAG: beta-ketoacyl-ACP synthase II [Angelakisella sp.]